MYRQFSLTIAFSIAISAFNALTLSPALSAMFLRGEEARPQQLDFLHIRPLSRAFAGFIHGADGFVTWLSKTYAKIIHVALAAAVCAAAAVLCGPGATVWIYKQVPTGFIPQEDQGYLIGIVQAPPGSSLAYTHGPCGSGAGDHLFEQGYSGRILDHGLQLYGKRFECGHDVHQHEAGRGAARARGTLRRILLRI